MSHLTPELEEIANKLGVAAANAWYAEAEKALMKKYPKFAAEVAAAPRGTLVIFGGE